MARAVTLGREGAAVAAGAKQKKYTLGERGPTHAESLSMRFVREGSSFGHLLTVSGVFDSRTRSLELRTKHGPALGILCRDHHRETMISETMSRSGATIELRVE